MDSQSQQHNDPLRAFFRLHIQDIPRVLQSIHETVVSMSRGVAEEGLQLLPEANNVVLVSFVIPRSAAHLISFTPGCHQLCTGVQGTQP